MLTSLILLLFLAAILYSLRKSAGPRTDGGSVDSSGGPIPDAWTYGSLDNSHSGHHHSDHCGHAHDGGGGDSGGGDSGGGDGGGGGGGSH